MKGTIDFQIDTSLGETSTAWLLLDMDTGNVIDGPPMLTPLALQVAIVALRDKNPSALKLRLVAGPIYKHIAEEIFGTIEGA